MSPTMVSVFPATCQRPPRPHRAPRRGPPAPAWAGQRSFRRAAVFPILGATESRRALRQGGTMSQSFLPHGYCYLWQPGLLWLHLISDSVITLSYYSIPIGLVWFVQKRRDVPFNWMFWLFAIFIAGCGTTHLMEIWTLWHPSYWL